MHRLAINKDTRLCISLAGRPGNFGTRFQNFLYERLQLNFVYKAFTTADIRAASSCGPGNRFTELGR